MNNQKFCPLEEALLSIQKSAKTTRDFSAALSFLHKTISSTLHQPNSLGPRRSDKEKELETQQLLKWKEFSRFLELIGFSGKDSTIEKRGVCDENVKLLEAALNVVNTYIASCIAKEKAQFQTSESVFKEPRSSLRRENQEGRVSEGKNSKLKEMLSRHLKHDQFSKYVMGSLKKRCGTNEENCGVALEGYFYQPCERKDNKKKKCFLSEMFDGHAFNYKQKGNVLKSS